MLKLRTLVAATALAFAVIPLSAPAAHACLSVQCLVNCVMTVANGEFRCYA